MKKINSILTLLALLLVISSCETPFNDYDSVRPDYARFSVIVQPTPPVTPPHNANMIVAAGQTTIARELEVFTSVVRDYERMFYIDLETAISLENFDFPSIVTIPANQARTTITFRANDVSLPSAMTPVKLILSAHESNTSSEILLPDFTFNVRTAN